MSAVACPFCERDDRTELVAPNGGQIITSQWRCRACGSYFEVVRDDFDRARSNAGEPRPDAGA